MEICERAEAFIEVGGELVFDHTKLILRRQDGDEYFYARTKQRTSPFSTVDIGGLEKTKIPTEDVATREK
ncbi:hypothetical protein DL546_003345 [Coniochaeta pulveracea]|uniref:Uncharacterized protein n=1 Tax=Coniochaeta pulveracea TaxID=177199 RepID=A0A420XYD7_9PEZI|nr:hypothetical protein DL546_003345 [Coniochaeta pulveracea]